MFVNSQLGRVARWILAALLSGLLPSAQSLYREWKSHAKLRVYENPFHAAPSAYTVPDGTANSTWVFQALGEFGSCAQRQVEVHLQHGGLPPIAFRNESFPENFYLNRTGYAVLKFPADNSSHSYTVLLPRPGLYYAFTFVTKVEDDNRLLPHGLSLGCRFQSWMFQQVEPGNYTNIHVAKKANVYVPTGGVTIWFRMRTSTLSYKLEVLFCDGSCLLEVAGPLEYGRPNSAQSRSCTGSSLDQCSTTVETPDGHLPHYFRLTSHGWGSDILVLVTPTECSSGQNNGTSENNGTKTSMDCLMLPELDRWQAPDLFHAHFLRLPEVFNLPDNLTLTLAPDRSVYQGFHMHSTKDLGTTLTVTLDAWQPGVTKDSQHIKLCGGLLKGKVISSSADLCSEASHHFIANSSSHLSPSTDGLAKLHVPYPEAGLWYLTLKLSCYRLDSKGDERPEKCSSTAYNVSVAVEVNPCMEGFCSAKGSCIKMQSGTDLLYYTFCDCSAGWRGYACTDGTEALPEWEILSAALLLTLSNLLFMPVIIVAMCRGFYAEAAAYAFNMFFSTFYHACDQPGRGPAYSLCILDFDTLQFADFMASTVSVWVTFMAATRITPSARSFLQVLGILCFAMVYALERFNIWNNLGTGIVAGLILASSWGFTCHERHSCYPNKKRYVYCFLPGVMLSCTAILVFMFAETKRNYKFTHSYWHIAICLAVLFFLPRKPLVGRGAFPVERVRSALSQRFPQYKRCSHCWRKSIVSLEMNYAVTADASNYTGSMEGPATPVPVGVVASPVRISAVASPVRVAEVASPVRVTEVASPVRKAAVASPVRKAAVASPVRKAAVASPARKAATSPVRKAAVASPVRKAAVASPIPVVVDASRVPIKGDTSSILVEVDAAPDLMDKDAPSALEEVDASPLLQKNS